WPPGDHDQGVQAALVAYRERVGLSDVRHDRHRNHLDRVARWHRAAVTGTDRNRELARSRLVSRRRAPGSHPTVFAWQCWGGLPDGHDRPCRAATHDRHGLHGPHVVPGRAVDRIHLLTRTYLPHEARRHGSPLSDRRRASVVVARLASDRVQPIQLAGLWLLVRDRHRDVANPPDHGSVVNAVTAAADERRWW